MQQVAVVYNARAGALASESPPDVEGRLTELFGRRGVDSVVRPFEPACLPDDVSALLDARPDALFVPEPCGRSWDSCRETWCQWESSPRGR